MKIFLFFYAPLRCYVLPAILLLIAYNSTAQGNLLISPKRMVLSNKKRADQFTLVNSGKDTVRYLVSIKEFKMSNDGSFTEVIAPDSTGNSAAKFIRFFPKSVTLAPNDPQLIKVQLFKADKMQPGEYRSHLLFRATDNLTTDTSGNGSKKLTVHVPITIGITLPVIIESGEMNIKTDIADLNLTYSTTTAPVLNFTINRTGNKSAFGDINIRYVSQQGKKSDVGKITNLAIYTPNARRKINMQLSGKNIDWHMGKLQIEFISTHDTKAEVFASAENILK